MERNNKPFLGIFVVVMGLLFLGLWQHSKTSQRPSLDHNSSLSENQTKVSDDGRVNYHLQELERQTRLNKIALDVENYKLNETLVVDEDGGTKKNLNEEYGANFDGERYSGETLRGVIRPESENAYVDENELMAEIHGHLKNVHDETEYDLAYKDAYVKEFIENARRAGYEVTVNSDLEVIKVKKIRRPSGFRYPNSVQGILAPPSGDQEKN